MVLLFVVGVRCAVAVLKTLGPHHFNLHVAGLVAAVAEAAARLSWWAVAQATEAVDANAERNLGGSSSC